MKLFAHQISDAKRLANLLRVRQSAANMGETGEGKTGTACAVAANLGCRFIVVCPKSTISHWKRWVLDFSLGEQCLGVVNWEACKLGLHPLLYRNDGSGWQFPRGAHVLVIFDEAHRAKNRAALNTKLMTDARSKNLYILAMSGTLIQSVLDLGGLAYPLGLVALPHYWRSFAIKYGLGINRKWGGYEDRSTTAQRHALHELLARISTRTKRSDIALESAITRADLLDMAGKEAICALYEDLAKKLIEIRGKERDAVNPLSLRLHARQKIELLKIPDFVEQAKLHLEEGCKVALFLNFSGSVHAAQNLLAGSVRLTGDTPASERDALLNNFNFGPVDVLVANIACASEGISLHDQDGKKPRVALISPPESATILLQSLGRIGGRLGSKSTGLNRILFCAGSIEEMVYDHVMAKISRIEDLNDGDLKI
jgi:superfamily II DNA or RNA helicase